MNQISTVSVLYLSNSKYQKKYTKKAPCMALFKMDQTGIEPVSEE